MVLGHIKLSFQNQISRRLVGANAFPEPKVGVHAQVFVGDWSEKSCKHAVASAKQAGFNMIEVPMSDPYNFDAKMTTHTLEDYGISASTSLGLPPDADINSEDGEVVARGKDLLIAAVKNTADIGAEHMAGVIYSAIKKYPGPCSAQARQNVVTCLQEVADVAADRGVTLCLEAVNRYETNVANTAIQAMILIEDIDRGNVKVHLDSYHMNIEEFSMREAVEACGDCLGYVHIGEAHRGYLGTGSVDFRELFRALAANCYTGPVTFESFSSAVVSKDLSNTLCVWRSLWDDGDDLAAHARGFIRAEVDAAVKGYQFH